LAGKIRNYAVAAIAANNRIVTKIKEMLASRNGFFIMWIWIKIIINPDKR
jgi:hypothetical protein